MPEFKLKQFSGPLDLLLSLIDDDKLSLSELSLSQVTEQYLGYLDQMEERKPEELADFLVIATKLLLLKSKQLLPQLTLEEEEGASLEDQLRLYKKFVEAAKKLNKQWLNGQRTAFRVEPTRRPTEFIMPDNATVDKMHESLTKLLKRITPLKPLPRITVDKTVLMREKIKNIRNLLSKKGKLSFKEILENSNNRTEIIVCFLSLLELTKKSEASLQQTENFTDIVVEKN